MYLAELFHGGPKHVGDRVHVDYNEGTGGPSLVVLLPGRFQPWHKGHNSVFQSLQAKFGRNAVYIATSNSTDHDKSPFNFIDKTILMNAAGIPSDRIIESSQPYKLPSNFIPSKTVFVVAIGEPDKNRLSVDSTKKDGTDSYFKTFKSFSECTTADKHGYVVIAAERQYAITLNGQRIDVSHGTAARAAWNMIRNDPQGRQDYMNQMFTRADSELGRILDKIPLAVTSSVHVQTEENIEENMATKPTLHTPMHPSDFDDLVRRVGQKAQQGPMKTIWVPDEYGTGGRYKVVPVNYTLPKKAPVKESTDVLSMDDYKTRRNALHRMQLNCVQNSNAAYRKSVTEEINRLTMQAYKQGIIPKNTYARHVQENKLNRAKAIADTAQYIKETATNYKAMVESSGSVYTGHFNDDDWYEVDPKTNTVLRHAGGHDSYRYQFGGKPISLPNGNIVVSGLRAKHLNKK